MIISSSNDPNKDIFNIILSESIEILNLEASKNPARMKKLAGTPLEQYVTDIMSDRAIGTPFEKTIICNGGISFPDIIANNYYGVEVKTTIKNHWKTTGNSVLENSRKKEVERIYILFGKLGDPVEFKYRSYEECLSEVVVTHSPRYLIDMNLAPDATIFNKINIPYDELRKNGNPIRPLVEYYKSLLKPGEELWWIGTENSESTSLVIRAWGNLTSKVQKDYRCKGFTYFPEILSKNQAKFNKFAIWLSTSQGVVCPNVRDVFTAGGKVDLVVNDKTFRNIPRIFKKLYDNRAGIVNLIAEQSTLDLANFWDVPVTENSKMEIWLGHAEDYSKQILSKTNHDLIRNIFEV